jgi:mannose-6-phosphate isomerase-like protein (cupin superfamily)
MKAFLDKLEELTNGLPSIPFFNIKQKECTEINLFTEYQITHGELKMFPLFVCDDISIAKGYMSKGSVIQKHFHAGCYEIIIILMGKMIIGLDNKTTEMEKFDKIIISIDQPHTAIAVSDCWFIAITVPRDEGFPRAEPV